MKRTLIFDEGNHVRTSAKLRRVRGDLFVRIVSGDKSARLYATCCRELAAWLIEAADEIKGNER